MTKRYFEFLRPCEKKSTFWSTETHFWHMQKFNVTRGGIVPSVALVLGVNVKPLISCGRVSESGIACVPQTQTLFTAKKAGFSDILWTRYIFNLDTDENLWQHLTWRGQFCRICARSTRWCRIQGWSIPDEPDWSTNCWYSLSLRNSSHNQMHLSIWRNSFHNWSLQPEKLWSQDCAFWCFNLFQAWRLNMMWTYTYARTRCSKPWQKHKPFRSFVVAVVHRDGSQESNSPKTWNVVEIAASDNPKLACRILYCSVKHICSFCEWTPTATSQRQQMCALRMHCDIHLGWFSDQFKFLLPE